MCRMARAKIVNDGDNQVIQLPEECRFPEDVQEVEVHRDGRNIVLKPPRAREWPPEFLATLGALDEELERLPQRDISELKDPFA